MIAPMRHYDNLIDFHAPNEDRTSDPIAGFAPHCMVRPFLLGEQDGPSSLKFAPYYFGGNIGVDCRPNASHTPSRFISTVVTRRWLLKLSPFRVPEAVER